MTVTMLFYYVWLILHTKYQGFTSLTDNDILVHDIITAAAKNPECISNIILLFLNCDTTNSYHFSWHRESALVLKGIVFSLDRRINFVLG